MNFPIRIKTFRSRTLQDAFQQIRTEFGPDASILETKNARYGIFGRSRIEVTASTTTTALQPMDTDPDPSDFISQPEPIPNLEPETFLASSAENLDLYDSNLDLPMQVIAREGEAPAEPWPASSAGASPSRCLSNELALQSAYGRPSGPQVQSESNLFESYRSENLVHQELIEAGIAPSIARHWIEAIRYSNAPAVMQDIWTLRSVLQGLIRDLVHVAPPIVLDDSRQQVIALVGPSGAGKTTTIAKLAANLSMQSGHSVGVLSTDSVRLGSNVLVQNCAEVFGWHFDVVHSIEQVPSCMEGFARCRFVLIDTCGCSPADTESLDRVNQFLTATKPTETHLVIPSTCNIRSFLRYEQGFERLNPDRMILTRLDESGGLGEFFSCLHSSGLPISYLSNGPRIPSDLMQATRIRLAQQIMDFSRIPE